MRIHSPRLQSVSHPDKSPRTVTNPPSASMTFALGESSVLIDGAKTAIFPPLTPISYLPTSAAVTTRPFLIIRSNDILTQQTQLSVPLEPKSVAG
jgi:hypothetical protein